MRIAIFGAGSTGCYLGCLLTAAGFEVTLICRPRVQQLIIDSGGITATDYLGGIIKAMPHNIITQVNNEVFDCIFVTLKCHQLPSALADLEKISNADTALVFMQNGIGSLDAVRSALTQRKIFSGITPFNVLQRDHAVYHKGTEGEFIFAAFAGAELLQTSLRRIHRNCELHQDMQPVIYGKLLLNLNNAINAIANLPIQQQLQQRQLRKLLAAAMTEWLAVCAAMGIELAQFTKITPQKVPHLLRLPNWLFKLLASKMLDIDPLARSSMWEDIQAGRKTEIEFLNGAVVRLGRDCGVATPVNEQICGLIAQLERGEVVTLELLQLPS